MVAHENETWLLPNAKKDEQSVTCDWQLTRQKLICGVVVKEIKAVPTGYGYLIEVFRSDWLVDREPVNQIFMSNIAVGGVSAWHMHAVTTDRLFVSEGMMRIVLYDNRPDSPTRGLINQFRFGVVRPALVVVPPRVWHGVENSGTNPAVLINAVNLAYQYEDPDHWRLPQNSPDIPFEFHKDL